MNNPPSASLLSASQLSVSYGAQTVLNNATLAISEGERVGLVGRNGCGKSTFLKIAATVLEPDSGEVITRRELVTGYLPQEFALDETASVHANILEGARHILDLIRDYETEPPESLRSGELLDHIHHFDGWNIEHRISHLVSHLGAPDPERKTGTLSGGEKRRVALCRALLARPDLLILDEPTNHLDTESILWLENYLAQDSGACLFVTHDRYFLDRIATRIVELANGEFISHRGNYTAYLEAKAERLATEEQTDRKRRKFLNRELEWVRRGPQARRTKSVDRIARYHEMAAEEGLEKELDIDLIIPPAPKLANRVIELKDGSMRLGGKMLFENLTLNLEAGTRIGIVGRNGLGKTTLVRILLKHLAPDSGSVEHGTQTQINYVDQSRLLLDDTNSVFQEVGEDSEHVRLGDETISLRAYLRRFLFTEDRINTRVSQLSGGERSRVILAKILKRGGNVLVLDEPTNDLDLATLRILEEALAAFGGTVIVVSHDRYFLNRICTGILAFEGDGRVFYNVGNYDEYLEKRSLTANQKAEKPDEPESKPAKKAERSRRLNYKETRELETMEESILNAEEEVAKLEATLSSPDFYANSGAEWKDHEAQLKSAQKKVAHLYGRWETLEKIRKES